MVGLVWKDTLALTPAQWIALYVCFAIGLFMAARPRSVWRDLLAFELYASFLPVVWRDSMVGIDVRTTWAQMPFLASLDWAALCSELPFVNYLKLQPPVYAFLLSRLPSYRAQQALAAVCGAVIFCAVYQARGRRIAWRWFATPLFQVMVTQPSNDWWACACLCLACLWSRTHRALSAALFLLACALKYTSYLVLPWYLLACPTAGLLVGAGVIAYWRWAVCSGQRWGTVQGAYLLKQFTVMLVHPGAGDATVRPERLLNSLLWRWQTLGRSAWVGGLWYGGAVWPTLSWPSWVTVAAIWAGYANCKYMVLLMPIEVLRHGKGHVCAKY